MRLGLGSMEDVLCACAWSVDTYECLLVSLWLQGRVYRGEICASFIDHDSKEISESCLRYLSAASTVRRRNPRLNYERTMNQWDYKCFERFMCHLAMLVGDLSIPVIRISNQKANTVTKVDSHHPSNKNSTPVTKRKSAVYSQVSGKG